MFSPVQFMRVQEERSEIMLHKIPVNTVINHDMNGKKKKMIHGPKELFNSYYYYYIK